MVKVDNFKLIECILFDNLPADNTENVLVGRIIRRRKENPEDPTGDYIVKRYTFMSKEKFVEAQEEIIKLCHLFNARFYISTNLKSLKDIALDISEKVPSLIRKEQFHFFKRLFDDSADANQGIRASQLWVFDIDDKSYVDPVVRYLVAHYPDKLCGIVNTVHGAHILMKPHDTKYIYDTHENCVSADGSLRLSDMIDVKKNSLTLVYYSDEQN